VKIRVTFPIWLGNDADFVSRIFQNPANDRRAIGRMVDIRVAGDEDHVTGFPSAFFHILSGNRKKF